MWHAPSDRKLVIQGKFRELFLAGVEEALEGWLIDGDRALEDDDPWSLSYVDHSEPYASLSSKEKLWVLAEVTRGLTTKCPTPELLQWNESAVYAVFETIAAEISVEIDNEAMGCSDPEFRTYWRRLASEAQRQIRDYDLPEDYIDPESDDTDEWEAVVTEDLTGLILWDDDFLERNAKIVCDNSPERAEIVRYFAGIPEDYYSTPIPLVTDKMLQKAKRFLKKTFRQPQEKKGDHQK